MLYQQYAESTAAYAATAVCAPGCADCCTTVGNVDVTTLEGVVIWRHLQRLDFALRKDLGKQLKQNRKTKKEARFARCAFLRSNNQCSIYAVRPFSCRRLYSLRKCGENGPIIHRQAWQEAEIIRSALQQLDDTGYSGHLSYILQLLNDARFSRTYLAGAFAPEEIRQYAMDHGITINRFCKVPTDASPR